jgi:hypothetical protein
MKTLAFALASAAAAFGGCLSFAPPPAGSACSAESPELRWLEPPAEMRLNTRVGGRYDPTLDDPALRSGAAVRGEQKFRFTAAGPHLLEVFIANPESDRFPFRLYLDTRLVDERPVIAPGPGRLRPKRGVRHTALLAMAGGPGEIAIRSEAPEYILLAIRWTPLARFESELVPQWRKRARWLQNHILTQEDGYSPTVRQVLIQQLSDRLEFSRDPEIRNEGLLGRTRAWFWVAAENHEPDDLLQTRLLFERGLKLFPENLILRQMVSAACLGQVVRADRMPSGDFCKDAKPVPWSVEVPAPPAGAPEWAVAQRQLMRRMDAITRWWVEKRQAPNGELGGGWGDDVEILRQWGPQALGFGSAAAARGVLNVAGGLWNSGTLRDGYSRGVSDVEHSSEPTTDTQPLAAALSPGDPQLLARLKQTAACADYWLAPQPDGALRFRSSWFNCREADTSDARAVDVHLNTRAMGPALWHAYLTRDPHVVALLAKWADSWIGAMRRTDHGKPKGAFPSVVRSKDGSYLVGSDRWDKPDAEWDYFQWSGGAQEALTSLVLAVYDLTGDRKYLDAAAESFAPMAGCAAHAEICGAMRGSPEAFHAWRRLTGDARFDAAFGYDAAPSDDGLLREATRLARETERRFAVNFEIMTSEVLYTDRVYYPLPPGYRAALFGGGTPRGDRYPTFAVTWPVAEAEFARLVTSAGPGEVRLRLYNFEAEQKLAPVLLWRLGLGQYTWESGGQRGGFTVDRLPHRLELPLPPRREVTVLIRTPAAH